MAYPIVLPFSQNTPLTGISSPPPGELMRPPQVDLGPAFAGAVYTFFLTGTSTPANVYQDEFLTTAFSPTGTVTADGFGRFPAIYLDNSITYKVTLTSSAIVAGSRTVDPFVVALATTGNISTNSAIGLTVNAQGEYTIAAPVAGGSGVTLTLNATAANLGAALALVGNQPGTPLLIVNNSVTTGAQTATFTATNKPGTATSAPVGWLPIKCDGVIYYTPLWFDNNFSRYGTGASAGAASAPVISAASFSFNGDGSITLVGTGATATPGQWFSPLQAGVGAGYYINITKTSGYTGQNFSAAQGAWTNIGAGGITIAENSSAQITGSYGISSSITGSPLLGTGTITLMGGNGVQSPSYNGPANLVLAGNGTATLNSVAAANWYLPTTGAIGAGFWINITRTGGTTGTNFTAAQGSWVNISAGGLTIGISGGSGSTNATGTYQIASDSLGANVVNQGTITLTGAFTGQTDTYSTAGTFFDTIPTGAVQVVIENWGASGAGGGGSGVLHSTEGSGGGSGGYNKTTLSLTSADWGKTIKAVVGTAGAGAAGSNGSAGSASTISSGTKTVTTMTGNGGGGGGFGGGPAGSGGTASGGSTNTPGNAGTVGTTSGAGIGGAGIVGTNGTGTKAGNGAFSGGGQNGGAGLAIFKYT